MSEKAAARRGAVGFQGGQVLSIRVPEAELEGVDIGQVLASALAAVPVPR